MSNNRYYRYYLNTVLDLVSTQCRFKVFSSSYSLALQKKFNYNFSVFRSSNGIFVYGAAFTFFGSKPKKFFSSKSIRSKKRYPIAVPLLENKNISINKRKLLFKGIEKFSVCVLPSRGAYGFLNFFPNSEYPTHINVFCKDVLVNPEMLNLAWRMRTPCAYSVWFKTKSESLTVS
jgi:hypothetical protein